MISTTGRMPVIAAPTPRPVMPGSEMGESMMRSGPNSSIKPNKTLKAVPASPTSSPMIKTRLSRRSSSARASLMASPKVRIRSVPLGEDMLVYLLRLGIGGIQGKLHRRLNLVAGIFFNLFKNLSLSQLLLDQPFRQDF